MTQISEQLSYWRKRLAGLSVLRLPTDSQDQASHGRAPRFAGKSFELSPAAGKELLALARQEGVSLFVVLLSAFKILLYRYTEQTDIAVGTIIGHCSEIPVNTLVLRTDISGDLSVRGTLSRVHETYLEAQAHQDFSLDSLMKELENAGAIGCHSMIPAIFTLQNRQVDLDVSGLMLLSEERNTWPLQPALNLDMVQDGAQIGGFLNYDTTLFKLETIDRMIGHLRNIVAEMPLDLEKKIRELPLLAQWEFRQQVVEWNQTTTPCPWEGGVHELFRKQAEQSPDAVAVISGRQQLTFKTLDERSNRLAHYLRDIRVGPESVVGVYMERSPDSIVGLLGILKAGGAYLPLDPAYPPDRLAFIIEDARIKVVVTQENLAAKLAPYRSQCISIDSDWKFIADKPPSPPISGVCPENLAYVIYTSGSTGKPKGVMVSHLSLKNLIAWHRQTYTITPADRATLLASPGFDAAVWELWPALVGGAAVVIGDMQIAASSEQLATFLRTNGVTVSFVVTQLTNQMIASDWEGMQETPLRLLSTGGDRMAAVSSTPIPFELVNVYGPTESTVATTTNRVHKDSGIGRPISNTQVYVLDECLNPVPIGITGELFIEGMGLARGYLNRPDLTADRFIPSPFGEPGTRLYRTGDRVRYLPDGNLDFLGRRDQQVKIRGYRIELEEIEVALTEHPGVSQVVVTTVEDRSTGKRLAAYVVPRTGIQIGAWELRSYLQERLPEYMVPSAFTILESLPLTPHGKVKRQDLPEPVLVRPELQSTFVAPRTPREKMLAQIWSEVLHVERVGIHDDFFELGGDSLSAATLLARLRQSLGQKLSLSVLSRSKTIENLASILEQPVEKARSRATHK